MKTFKNIAVVLVVVVSVKLLFFMTRPSSLNSGAVPSSSRTALAAAPGQQAQPTAGFERLALDSGIEIDVPVQWEPLPKELTTAIRTTAEAVMANEGVDSGSQNEKLLVAYTSRPATTYASLRVKQITPPSLTPAELLAASDVEVASVGPELARLIAKPMAKQGQDLQPGATASRELIAGHPALVFRYRRLGEKGIVVVEQIKVMTSNREIAVTLSYRESEAVLWRPVIENIRRSIKVF